VQSYANAEAYDASHQEILVTIAAQAAVAIENARLYGRTDEALARRVQELGSILRTTRDGIMLLDADLRVLAANRALADLLSVAQAELPGQGLLDPWPGQPGSLAGLVGYTAASLAGDCAVLMQGHDTACKQTVTLAGPGERHVERTLTPVHDREGAVSGWLVTLRDVTEEIEHAQLKEDMMRMLVHDLRSPLTVIKGSLDLMGLVHAEGNEAKFRMLLEMAQRNDDHLLQMVGDLLDISRLEDGQQPVHPEPLDVRAFLEENVARFGPLFTSARLAVDVAVEPDLPPLHADQHLIERVLGNLLNNAIKFTPDGGTIRVWARLDPGPPAGGILVGVTDSGPGIPAEEQSRLFQKFHRVDNVHGRWTGTGLGLSFCKLAVEAHGGRIWVESQVGHGSTFVMALPGADHRAVEGS
jgi:NtrC-family two-component system sensor histidine kinase KinB